MLALTSTASTAIEEILSASTIPDGAGVRIAPTPGVDGVSPDQFEVRVAGAPDASDQVIDEDGARVFVDEAAAPLLDDKLLDADVADNQVQFVLAVQE